MTTILILVGIMVGGVATHLYYHHKFTVLQEKHERQELYLAKLKLSAMRFIPEPAPGVYCLPIENLPDTTSDPGVTVTFADLRRDPSGTVALAHTCSHVRVTHESSSMEMYIVEPRGD